MRRRVLSTAGLAVCLAVGVSTESSASGGSAAGIGLQRGAPVSAAWTPDGGGHQSRVRTAASAQVRVVSPADLTVSGTTTIDGAVQVDGRGGDLTFTKKVFQDGSFTLEMAAPKDRVSLSFSGRSITVRRGRKAVTLSLERAREEEFDRARRLLADSRAVRLLRAAAAAVEESDEEALGPMAVVTSDALVGLLTGDVGAPGRAARRLARRGRAHARRIGMQNDCYHEWQQRVLVASYEWEACAYDFSVWNPIRHLCAASWLLAIESYWFSFITCSGFGFMF
jgi:hypothetical protein